VPAATRPAPPVGLFYGAVLVGGMLGGATRYLVSLAFPPEPGEMPWGILTVNLVGAFVLSLLLSGWIRRGHVAHPFRPFLATGLIGSFTTWSTFMAETQDLFRDGAPLLGATYLVGATGLGAAFAGLGWWVAQRVVPHVDDEVAP
jgi:CrcB protein